MTPAWLQARYAVLADRYRRRRWVPPAAPLGIEQAHVLYEMVAMLNNREPLRVQRRTEPLIIEAADED